MSTGAELGGDNVASGRMRFAVWLVAGALFMEALDSTIITTALPAMAQSFHVTALRLNVGVSAYLLAAGIFVPISGWVADRFGARRVFATAVILFTASSAACGASGSLFGFTMLRILQGAAGAMMTPVGRLVVMRSTPRERLMAALSAMVWPALIAPVLAPPLGGFVTLHLGWRWIFYLNVPLGLAALVATFLVIPNIRGTEIRRFDRYGFAMSSVGIFAMMAGLECLVNAEYALGLPQLAVGLGASGLALRHFARVEHPLLDLGAYRIATFRAAIRGGSLFRIAIAAAPFLLPLMFQLGFGFDPFRSGLLLLAVFAGNVSTKLITTPVLRRFGYRRVMIWNGLFAVATLAGCALLQSDTPTLAIVLLLFAGGVARSMQFTSLSTLAYADVPAAQMGDANSLFATVLQLTLGAGVTLGAMALKAGQWLTASADRTLPTPEAYRWAFVVVALVALASLIDAFGLPAGAGANFVRGAEEA